MVTLTVNSQKRKNYCIISLNIIICFFTDLKRSTNSNVLTVMKYSYKKKNRISRDLMTDCQGALNVCEGLCMPSNSSCLQGYIQKINLVPFGLFMVSDIQVNLQKKI